MQNEKCYLIKDTRKKDFVSKKKFNNFWSAPFCTNALYHERRGTERVKLFTDIENTPTLVETDENGEFGKLAIS